MMFTRWFDPQSVSNQFKSIEGGIFAVQMSLMRKRFEQKATNVGWTVKCLFKRPWDTLLNGLTLSCTFVSIAALIC